MQDLLSNLNKIVVIDSLQNCFFFFLHSEGWTILFNEYFKHNLKLTLYYFIFIQYTFHSFISQKRIYLRWNILKFYKSLIKNNKYSPFEEEYKIKQVVDEAEFWEIVFWGDKIYQKCNN